MRRFTSKTRPRNGGRCDAQGATSRPRATRDGYVVYAGAPARGDRPAPRPRGGHGRLRRVRRETGGHAGRLQPRPRNGSRRIAAGRWHAGGAGRGRYAAAARRAAVHRRRGRRSTSATLAVTGCAVDTDPAPPWGRAVTAPGAATCQVKVAGRTAASPTRRSWTRAGRRPVRWRRRGRTTR